MKRLSLRTFVTITVAVLGTAMIGLATLATRLGIDHNNVWGPRRISLFVVGVLSLFLSVFMSSYERVSACLDVWKERIGRFLSRLWELVLDSSIVKLFVRSISMFASRFKAVIVAIPFVKYLSEKIDNGIPRIARSFRYSPVIRYLSASKERKAVVTAWSLFAVIVLAYVWLVSVGRWTDWPGTTAYYEMLSNALRHGQTHLMIDPDPRLLALPDPYDYEARKHIPIPWDVVLYEGKYYLYWGPVPGMILAGLRLFVPVELGDQYLVFGFAAGSLFFSVLLILTIWRDLFQDSPWWMVIPGVLVAGFGNPMPWLLTRPAVYEAAISSGQFFLVAGIYWAFTGLRSAKPVQWRIALAGISWVFAMGSRTNLAIAIVFLILMVVFRIHTMTPRALRLRRNFWAFVVFIIPLVLGVVGLGLYNQARFGSMLEFGHRYQLTGKNLHLGYGLVWSTSYIIHNLNNYLLNPFRTLPVFPFVKPIWGRNNVWALGIWAPEHYCVEQVAGILTTTPYVMLAAIPVFLLLSHSLRKKSAQSSYDGGTFTIAKGFTGQWLIITLLGVSVLEFIPLLFFLYSTMRYLADFVPTLVLLSTIGSYQGYRMTSKHAPKRKAFLTVLLLAALISVLLGFLLSVTGYDARFENLNPALFDRIERLLAW